MQKRYGEVELIHGIDLSIEPDEFAVFVVSSGYGKSTLLRMIAGLDPSHGGDLLIDGQRINTVPPAKVPLGTAVTTTVDPARLHVFDVEALAI